MSKSRDPLFQPSVALVAAALVAALFGLRARSPTAEAFAVALASLLAAAYLYVRFGKETVAAERRVGTRAYEDERVEVRFAVENRGALPLVGLELEDLFAADRAPKKTWVVYPALLGGTRVEASYAADCDLKRGVYAVGPLAVTVTDPLGILARRRELGQVERVLVYPQVFPIARLPRGGGGTRYDIGARLAAMAGAGIEFLGVREYRPGDPPRLIHWPSSARHGNLVVKEFEETAAEDIAIFLDLTRLGARGIGRVSTLEYAIKVAASVAAYAARGTSRIRVYGRGARPLDVPSGTGDVQVAAILEALALARADGDTPLPLLLRETASALSRGATAVVIFSSLEIDLREHAEVLAIYRARGVKLVAILLDARTFLRVFDDQIEVEMGAPANEAVVANLVAEGATVYTIARNDDLAARLDAPVELHGRG